MANLLFIPDSKVVVENEYFMVRNEIFDLNFRVRSFKRYKENGKFIKDKFLVEYRELDTFELATYIYLCRCANNKDNAFPSYNGIASKIKCSRSKAQEAIEILFQNGFIYKENRTNEKNEYISNVYVVNTKLKDLKNTLDSLYEEKATSVISVEEKNYILGIPSDNTPILSDNIPPIPSDNTPIPSDGKEKEQHNKNNFFKEKQNNNKENIVVNKELDLIESYITKLVAKPSKKDINIIYKDFKKIEDVITPQILELRFNAIEIYMTKNKIENIIGLIRKAIKEQWDITGSIPRNRFNNYEQRQYESGEIERKMGIIV